jgi:hypothetical protein
MRRLSDVLHCSFIVLELDSASGGVTETTISLKLGERGQILASGKQPIQATICLLYDKNHFDVLVPVSGTSGSARYKWDQVEPAEAMFFVRFRMLPDHACGWSGVAISLNVAKVQIPEEYKEPVDRSNTVTPQS